MDAPLTFVYAHDLLRLDI